MEKEEMEEDGREEEEEDEEEEDEDEDEEERSYDGWDYYELKAQRDMEKAKFVCHHCRRWCP